MLIKILSLLLGLAAISLALQCYSCVLTYGDNTCLDNPGAVQPGPSTVDCVQGKDCCTIVRGDHLEMKGTPWTFQRGCRPNCTKTGVYEVEDSTNVFYRTYCKTTLCNIGNGKDPLPCPSGYDLVEGYCLKVSVDYLNVKKTVTFEDAQTLCQQSISTSGKWKSNLAFHIDDEKLQAIGKHIFDDLPAEMSGLVFWVGGQKLQDSWKWINGDLIDLSSHIWLPGQPVPSENNRRMQLVPADQINKRFYATSYKYETPRGLPSYVCEATY
ncbi:uncharacterized protein LOC143039520 [Oratosquilla oratoria]|uniref:uncharacterized protein LOC143039520 n=1 Tax=Oratosquilla oratoria TaxID=337810 RepID=UPI003F767184